MATVFFQRRAGPIGPVQTPAATPAWLYWARYARKTKKGKGNGKGKLFRPQAAKIYSGCWGFYRPIRSGPKFGKANSIVWMIPNERAGAWMPLGRVCLIGFGKQGSAGTRARGVRKGIPPLALGYRGVAP